MTSSTADPPLELVVMGAGTIGQRHIDTIAANPRCQLVAIIDTEQRANLSDKFSIYPDVASMLKEHKPHGVIIATPTKLHEEHTITCLNHGLPTLVEKPVATDLAAAARMEAAATKAKIPVLVGHVRRHSPVITKARQLIHQGVLGDIVAVSVMWCVHKPPHYFGKSWRLGEGGGPLLINTIHDLDTLRYLVAEISDVQAFVAPPRRNHGREDTAVVIVRFANEALGTITVSDIASSPWSWELNSLEKTSYDHPKTGQDCYLLCGTISSLGLPSLQRWHHEKMPDWRTAMASEQHAESIQDRTALDYQLEHFLAVIRGEAQPLSSIADASKTLSLILQVLESFDQPHQ